MNAQTDKIVYFIGIETQFLTTFHKIYLFAPRYLQQQQNKEVFLILITDF